MAATAILSSPRAAAVGAASSPSSRIMASPTTPSRSSNSKDGSDRLNAAADLIRNLDAALSGMTAAATSASQDAARARRNAKAAGEVARRYGGTSRAGKGDSDKKKKEGGTSENLLERTRERRAAARMAAEARQRREHPMLISPRRTPRSTRGGVGVFWGGASPPTAVAIGDGAAAEEVGVVRDRTTAATRAAKVEMKVETEHANREVNVGGVNPAGQKILFESTPLGNTEVLRAPACFIADSIPEAKTEESNASNLNEFEDAMEQYHDGAVEEAHYGTNAAGTAVEQNQPPRPQATEEVANDYYTQSNSHYNQQHQQQPYCQSNQGQNEVSYNENQWQQPHSNLSLEQQTQQQQSQAQQQLAQPTTASSLTVATAAADQSNAPQPPPKHSVPPTPPRSQPTSTNRIEASHAEDVLTLSLELERVRSQLVSTTSQLSDATTQVGYLTAQNSHLSSELSNLHSQFESTNERSSTQLSTLQEQLEGERLRSKAAEEDAALALELAKEAQSAKDECEMWLTRSLEEIDLWRGRVGGLEHQLKELQETQLLQEGVEATAGKEEPDEERRKSVRFKEDCPPSPVVSEDGGFEEDVPPEAMAAARNAALAATQAPPPPPVWSSPPGAKKDVDSHVGAASNNTTSPIVANDGISGMNSGIFSPHATNNTPNSETLSKSDFIASGRVYLQRASPPLKNGLSPHPRAQATDLLKKSAETRRLLRERLTPGYNGRGGVLHKPPMASAKMPRPSSENSLNENHDSFASRQGATCKAIGRTIRESGARLKLDGKWWDSALLLTNNSGSSPAASEPVIEGVAQLESMVKGYCGGVEGTIDHQRERINELLAFCDHLEKEVMLDDWAGSGGVC